jgi:butyryl-CoA dehydrogenase
MAVAGKFVSKRNLKFMLYEVFDTEMLTRQDYFAHHNRKAFDLIIDATVKLAADLMRPVLEEMDRQPPILEDGHVRVHPSVRGILRECGQGGWIAAIFSREHDGEQLPLSISAVCRFIFAAANYSASVYPELSSGAAHLITAFGSRQLIDTYVPRLLAGEWQGTMALTEPQAGSSLSDITTAAAPIGEGVFQISGQKIFISAGDHDGAENVVHLMLAKIEGAPEGVKGISLFVVPKRRFDDGGALVDNDVTVSQIYHKLGYRGAPITELSIGEKNNCRGYLVGEPHRGLAYMFQMMNEARIGVGLGAAAIATAAYYAALEYANARPQGRPPGQKDPSRPQIPIVEHADVKRMLLFQRAVVEGSLALILQCCHYADRALVSEGEEKNDCLLLLDLLTPVAKSYPSETGILAVSLGLQCLGGYGYCRDFPLEQYYRDIRIHPIHEGTTGIQGMDLLGRKIPMQGGRAFELYLREVQGSIREASRFPELQSFCRRLEEALATLQNVTRHLLETASARGVDVFLSDATLYLEFFGIIAIAWQWLRQAAAVVKALEGESKGRDGVFYEGKFYTLRYFYAYELPKIRGLAERLTASDPLTVEMSPACFKD